MPNETRTWYPNREQSVADTSSGADYGNGGDDHAPIGSSGGWTWRELIRFAHDFAGWEGAKFVQARMRVKTTTQVHLARGGTPRCSVGRLGSSFSASGGGENSWSATGTVWPGPGVSIERDMPVDPDTNSVVVEWDVSDVFEPMLPATTFKRDGSPGAAAANNGFRIRSFDESSGARTTEFFSMRGSYQPRLLVTMLVEDTPGAPTLGEPTGTKAFQQGTFFATATATPGKYDIQVSESASFSPLLWSALNQTSGISGTSITVPYTGPTQPTGVPIYWRVRTANSLGVFGPWSAASSFSISVVPTAVVTSPTAGGLAEVHNLGEAVEWTDAGLHAKPRIKATYSHASGTPGTNMRISMYTTADVLIAHQDFPGTYVSGVTYSFDLSTTRARSATSNFKVAVTPTAGTSVGVESTRVSARMQWGQGQYTQAIGAGTSDWQFQQGVLAGTGAKVAFLFRGRGGTTGPWKTTIGAVTPDTNLDILVRLSTTSANPTLPSMTVLWSASAPVAPDHWAITGGALTLDATFRRFGVKSMRVVTTASTACRLYPVTTTGGGLIPVSPATKYTLSTFVHTLGVTLPDWVQLAVFDDTDTLIHAAPTDGRGATKSSAAGPEGWQRLYTTFETPAGTTAIRPAILLGGGVSQEVRFDGHQLEEGTVAAGWKPGGAGQSVSLDVGGVGLDASLGAIFRLRGSTGGLRDIVELRTNGLAFGGATSPVEVHSPQANVLHVGAARLTQQAKPASPAAGTGIIYASTTPDVRFLLPDGSEVVLSGGGASAHSALSGLTTGDDHTQYQKESEKEQPSGYAGLNASSLVQSTALANAGTADVWNALVGNRTWDTRIRLFAASAVICPNTTWQDTGLVISFDPATDTSMMFFGFLIHNRQAAGGALQFRWLNVGGGTGGNVRGVFEPGDAAGTSWGTYTPMLAYDTAYGVPVPSANNSPRYARLMGRLLFPTSAGASTIKLQVNSVTAAEAQLTNGTWLQYAKF